MKNPFKFYQYSIYLLLCSYCNLYLISAMNKNPNTASGGGVITYCYQPPMNSTANTSIYTINIDGTNNTKISDPGLAFNHPDWSPDGLKIAVSGKINESTYSIRVMNSDGSNLKRLTYTSGVIDMEPNWSPDGTKISFARAFPLNDWRRELWVMDADGGNQHWIGMQLGDAAEWSQDGQRLIFSFNPSGKWEIFSCKYDGTDLKQLTNRQADNQLQGCSFPDGKQIMFNTTKGKNDTIYIMNSDGTQLRKLMTTTSGIWKSMPSPDGNLIAFCSYPSNNSEHWEIFVMDSEGTNIRQVTHSPGNFTSVDPDWRPAIKKPYFGETPPNNIPTIFAPAIIPFQAWGITFSPDGLECFFSKTFSVGTILTSKDAYPEWTTPVISSFSGKYLDIEPHITPDGKKLFFGSFRPLEGADPNILHQWYLDKTDTGWSIAYPMDPPLRTKTMMYPSVANNGNMYFTTSNDNFQTQWIALSRYLNGKYQEPERLSDSINFSSTAAHPFIAPDESYIIFDVLTMPYSTGDLFISFRKTDNSWTRAISLGKTINTADHEACATVSRNGKYLFFTRGNNIYWVDAAFIEKLRPVTGVKNGMDNPPSNFRLNQNYPNPFNPSTTIRFEIPKLSYISLRIYNTLGEPVKTLINDLKESGSYSVTWDGINDLGNKAASGIYFFILKSSGIIQMKKGLLMK